MVAGRMSQLDGLRALAVIAVITWHYVVTALQLHGHVFKGAEKLLLLSWSGVDLFLVLSGYLIADILFKAKNANNYFQVFYRRRLCRLIPMYAILLTSFFVARFVWAGNETFRPMLASDTTWTYFLLLQNFAMAIGETFGAGWMTPTWSLALEWQFYLLFPVLVRFAPRRIVLAAAVAGIVVAPLLRSMVVPVVGYVSLPTRMDALFVGVLLAHLLNEPKIAAACRRSPMMFAGGMALLFGGVLVMAVRPEAFGGVMPWYGTFTHSWLAFTYGGALASLILFPDGFASRLLARKPIVLLGQLAYAAYLVHQPMIRVLFGVVQNGEPNLDDAAGVVLTLLAVVLTFGLSWILYTTVETRFIAFGRRIHYDYGEAATRTPMPVTTPRPLAVARS